MKYLLDTNICIYTIRRQSESVVRKLQALDPLDVGISVVTVAELEFGVAKSQFPEKNRSALEMFLLPFIICPFREADAKVYGSLRNNLQKNGTPIGSMDMLIAAQAISLNCILVTNNVREFSRIKDLQIENWVDEK